MCEREAVLVELVETLRTGGDPSESVRQKRAFDLRILVYWVIYDSGYVSLERQTLVTCPSYRCTGVPRS